MKEQSNATQNFFAQLSVWVGLATASLCAFGFCYEQAKYHQLGIGNTSWLGTSDILGAVRDSFLGATMMGTFYLFALVLIFRRLLPGKAIGLVEEIFAIEGPINKDSAVAAKLYSGIVGLSGLGVIILLAFIADIFQLKAAGSLYTAVALAVFGLFVTVGALAMWFEVVVRLRSRLLRILFSASAAALVLGITGLLAGGHDADELLAVTSPNIEVQLTDGSAVQGVLADATATGYLVLRKDVPRLILFEHPAVKLVRFLSTPHGSIKLPEPSGRLRSE
jgi:hypothetical protein